MFLMSFEVMLLWMGVGSLIIVILAIAFGWRRGKPRLV